MQNYNLYAMKDTEADLLAGPVFQERMHGAAVRAFNDVLGRENQLPGQYPQHFILLHLGNIDLETGTLTPLPEGPRTIATGEQWLAAKQTAQTTLNLERPA